MERAALAAWFVVLAAPLACEDGDQGGGPDEGVEEDGSGDLVDGAEAFDADVGEADAGGDEAGEVAPDEAGEGAGDEADGVADPGGDAPPLPELRPVTAARAAELGAYARRLRRVFSGGPPRATAWASVGTGCVERAYILEYALVSAPDPPGDGTPVMTDTEVTVGRLAGLLAEPAYDVATISAVGPCVTEQTIVAPSGAPLSGAPERWYWAGHEGVVLNVDGELRVLDLSVGDRPIAIADWIGGFLDPSVPCPLMSDDQFRTAMDFWNAALGGDMPPARPEPFCGYALTSPFTTPLWPDDDPAGLVPFVSGLPAALQLQQDFFVEMLRRDYGLAAAEDETPGFTSRYAAGTEADLCAWFGLACGLPP